MNTNRLSSLDDATLRRLTADDGPAFEPRRAVGLRFGAGTDRAPYVVFRAPSGLEDGREAGANTGRFGRE